MASTAANSSQANLATILLIRRKQRAARNKANPDEEQIIPPQNATGSYSQDKLNYRQDVPVTGPIKAPTPPAETNDPPKISRKTKQLEVSALDKKMEEISRKQEAKTNETAENWKGFDSLNYGLLASQKVPQKPTATPPKQVNYLFIFK